MIGHFAGDDLEPAHRDWLASRSSYGHPALEDLWNDVATFIGQPGP